MVIMVESKYKDSASSQKPILENIQVFPAGRGKVRIEMTKRIKPKSSKHRKSEPRFTHTRIRSNPQDITITEYLGDGDRKYIYLFPEKRELSFEERQDLALSLLATLPYVVPRYLGTGNTIKSYPIFLSHKQRQILKSKWKRYCKWRKRQK